MNRTLMKIRISYNDSQELHTVLKLLNPVVKSWKADKGKNGAVKRAYIDAAICNEMQEKP